MRQTISLTLIAALLMPALSASAESLADAIAREAARLASSRAPQAQRSPMAGDWSRVIGLAGGTAVTVTVEGSPPANRSGRGSSSSTRHP